MYMWGHNKDGQLGNDSNMDSGKPVLVEQFRDAGLKVQSIACAPPRPAPPRPRAHPNPVLHTCHVFLWMSSVHLCDITIY